MARSFEKATGKSLVPPAESDKYLAEALYRAPFVLVCHNTDDDHVFNYANMNAQLLWEMEWNEFVNTPYRNSAEVIETGSPEALLEEAGVYTGYEGIRISKSGKRFTIHDAILWNVYDDKENYCGQATTFSSWTPLPE